ncbi:MAG TPA: nucleotide sugar dehydrogenase [Thermoplasmata archaeon]|nr:nucleotide sugar dehydrogenase [Thermoplasmata archaeon]
MSALTHLVQNSKIRRIFKMVTKIAVIGMGYVGIPCAALLADVDGYDVTGIQRRSKRSGWKIEVLNSGKSPIEGDEPGLEELIAKVVKKGTFRVTDNFDVLSEMDIILIDVQTPTDENNLPRYESLKEVSKEIGKRMKKGTLVVTESTVAPGTTRNIILPILEKYSGMKGGKDFYLAFSYERVMPGKLLEYIVNFPRVVGGIDQKSTEMAVEMYKKIVKKAVHATEVTTAELAKTIENAYRDVNIAFANEMALVCESLGVDVYEVRELINERHDRHMHIPGIGVGGHCLPKDTWLLRHGLMAYGSVKKEPEFITLARRINNYMPIHGAHLVKQSLEEKGVLLTDAVVTILGVAYLENSDDTRNTPARTLYNALKEMEIKEIRAHDPYVRQRDFPEVEVKKNLEEVVNGSDCLVIATKHRQYYNMDLEKLKSIMRTPIIVDGRNVLTKEACEKVGIFYRGIGKGQ